MSDSDIVRQVLAQLQAEFGAELLGVLVAGSRLRGEGDAFSDIDLVVAIATARRRRRNIVVDGVEVEMFLNPPFQMQRYFEEDRESGRGLMQHMLGTGTIVYDPHGVMAEFQHLAQQEWVAGPPLLTATEQWHMRYAHADNLRDIADVLAVDPQRATYLIGRLLPEVIDNHYRIQGRWHWKAKRVLLDLATWDSAAAQLARRVCSGELPERFAALEALSAHALAPLGGQMPLEWQTDWEELS